ncbi:hypothetical protein [Algicella marina]|uniref:Uncharacterized protein n=1 Tax=Algicella marina TaxID=2683284 RepID=A0A6P1T636_9RHOB|nr:hypothetical protein [Algicella marina]QHQ36936.1 hypothetical protein GO499_17985 [Algicella marina]
MFFSRLSKPLAWLLFIFGALGICMVPLRIYIPELQRPGRALDAGLDYSILMLTLGVILGTLAEIRKSGK